MSCSHARAFHDTDSGHVGEIRGTSRDERYDGALWLGCLRLNLPEMLSDFLNRPVIFPMDHQLSGYIVDDVSVPRLLWRNVSQSVGPVNS